MARWSASRSVRFKVPLAAPRGLWVLMRFTVLCLPALLVYPGDANSQSVFRVGTESSLNFTLFLLDTNGKPIPNTILTIEGVSNVGAGGHNHPIRVGGVIFRLGRIEPTQCTTGISADRCRLTVSTNQFGGEMRVRATIQNGPQAGQVFEMPQPISISARSGHDMPTRLENFGSSDFALIGQTATHPNNHYCETAFCNDAVQLARDYRARWDRILAYNDASLKKGGKFDINANWQSPHAEHRTGRNVDVRANGATNSIPFNNEIRQWFVSRVIAIFGQAPLHEAAGTSNEHYHIRG